MAQTRALSAILAVRRGYSAAARVRAAEEKAVMVAAKREADAKAAKGSWVPDPVTGYYRPGNRAKEVDAAELRESLLKGKGPE